MIKLKTLMNYYSVNGTLEDKFYLIKQLPRRILKFELSKRTPSLRYDHHPLTKSEKTQICNVHDFV